MSELLHRAIDDLDGRAPGGAQDASRRLIEEVRQGADRNQLAATVNQIEMQPGHAGVQIAVGTDSNGYLAFVPVNGYAGDQGQPPPPPIEAPQQVIVQQENPNIGPAVAAGVIGLITGLAIGNHRRDNYRDNYRENYYEHRRGW